MMTYTKQIFGIAALAATAFFVFKSRPSIPKGAKAVTPFNLQKYLGKWYEIARLDYYWEKNLDNVNATYSLRDNGLIKVDNRGRDTRSKEWKQSIGKAKPAGDQNEGRLKVSFFGPFYSGYNVIAIDSAYQYALVAGENLDYLWLLSRYTTMPDEITQDYISRAAALGYKTDKLVWVKHD